MERWLHMRETISKRTDIFFNSNLSRKNYSGRLKFDHDQETLEISVQLDKLRPTNQIHMVSDTKELSGGERSYSTVALLLALWEQMENPFRAMDEFDVYMVKNNKFRVSNY